MYSNIYRRYIQNMSETFYQVINIGAFLPDIDAIMPIFLIPTTGKSEVVYNEIFSDVKKILIENNINITKIINKFLIDFDRDTKSFKKYF